MYLCTYTGNTILNANRHSWSLSGRELFLRRSVPAATWVMLDLATPQSVTSAQKFVSSLYCSVAWKFWFNITVRHFFSCKVATILTNPAIFCGEMIPLFLFFTSCEVPALLRHAVVLAVHGRDSLGSFLKNKALLSSAANVWDNNPSRPFSSSLWA